MSNILHIATSPNAAATSQSRRAAQHVLDTLDGTLHTRDLAQTALPQLTADWNAARLIPAHDRTPQQKATLALSDQLIQELNVADIIVIGMPMYNFGIPAALKAWVDLVCRPKVTFAYTPDGVKGLLSGKRAIIVAASGGVPIGSAEDYATPHLRHVLNFIGITDTTTFVAGDVITANT